jgi:hypothetical protein
MWRVKNIICTILYPVQIAYAKNINIHEFDFIPCLSYKLVYARQLLVIPDFVFSIEFKLDGFIIERNNRNFVEYISPQHFYAGFSVFFRQGTFKYANDVVSDTRFLSPLSS